MDKQTQAAAHAGLMEAIAALTVVAGLFNPDEAAAVTPPVKAAKAAAPKAPAGKVFRSKPGKEQAKLDCAALYEADRQKYGVKRWSAIPAGAQAKTRAKCEAIWAAVPKTRTTKG